MRNNRERYGHVCILDQEANIKRLCPVHPSARPQNFCTLKLENGKRQLLAVSFCLKGVGIEIPKVSARSHEDLRR